jgi:hypothetical protein
MLRSIIFACATALALPLVSFAAPTDGFAASAAKKSKAVKHGKRGRRLTRHRLLSHRSSRQTGCWEAECGGNRLAIDDEYIIRQCNLTPPGHSLPPWCN